MQRSQQKNDPHFDDDVDHDILSPSDPLPAKRAGRKRIKIEYIEDKNRRHITFSKRKAGIMKKAYELSTLTGTQVLLLIVSETGLVYTFTTPKLQPMVTKPEGKTLIQSCLNAPDPELQGDDGSPRPTNTKQPTMKTQPPTPSSSTSSYDAVKSAPSDMAPYLASPSGMMDNSRYNLYLQQQPASTVYNHPTPYGIQQQQTQAYPQVPPGVLDSTPTPPEGYWPPST
ncbi:srf-tf-domain-containing partial [Lichtheimia corymbifera JMRC:FSU:9682]|uniref:Srf-tf-domain-containing partial n=1 Tax=Lichtheimia corymbifera JMRC:FSU:9682 TaxID=1263082 RepID=A0A068S6L8_9FUNG|nr:srf-tf-domain-containing partial [Lichtheimia corymbifera JMRC:FSU:9682]